MPVQAGQQGAYRCRRIRPEVARLAQPLLGDIRNGLVFRQRHQPRMAGGAARQAQVDAHVGVVEQPGFRALGLGHQGESLAIHDRQPHQFACGQSQAVNDRLRNIDHARAA